MASSLDRFKNKSYGDPRMTLVKRYKGGLQGYPTPPSAQSTAPAGALPTAPTNPLTDTSQQTTPGPQPPPPTLTPSDYTKVSNEYVPAPLGGRNPPPDLTGEDAATPPAPEGPGAPGPDVMPPDVGQLLGGQPGAGEPGGPDGGAGAVGVPGGVGQMPGQPGSNYPVIGAPGVFQAPGVGQNELMSYQLNQLLQANSPYLRNAAIRGREMAASRGLGNSSIAAGASMRSALEAAAPIAQFDASRYGSVADMGRQFQYSDAMANNQAVRQNWLDAESTSRNAQWQDALAENAALRQNWLASEDFNRSFNAQLALMPIANSADMLQSLMQAAINDPTVFTPTVLTGFQDFFQGAFNEYIGRYLGNGGG